MTAMFDVEQIIEDIKTLPLPDGKEDEKYRVLPFQADYLRGTFAPGITRSGLSVGRSGGKTTFLAAIVACCLLEGMELFSENNNVPAFSGTFKQAEILGEKVQQIILRLGLEKKYRTRNSTSEISLQHKASGSRFRCFASNSKGAHGLDPFPVVICDELATWRERDGKRLWSAITTGLKREGARILAIGTRSDDRDHFFEKLLFESSPSTFSMCFSADEKADLLDPGSWLAANPGLPYGVPREEGIRSEAERTLTDPSEVSSFRALKLNQGVSDTFIENFLIDPDRWADIEKEIPEYRGEFILAIDLGGEMAFTAACALYLESGALRILQATGGHTTLKKKEKEEFLPEGYYQRMFDDGELLVLGRRIVPVPRFLQEIEKRWGRPSLLLADMFRKGEVLDFMAAAKWKIKYKLRGMGFKDGAADVEGFRRAVNEKKVSAPKSRSLRSSLAGARTVYDAHRNEKQAKGSEGGRLKRHRDDLASSAVLVCAEFQRRLDKAERPLRPRSRISSLEHLPSMPPKTESKRRSYLSI